MNRYGRSVLPQRRRRLGAFRRVLPRGGKGHRLLLRPVQLLEQADIEHTEGCGNASQENYGDEKQRDDGLVIFRRLGTAGAVDAVIKAAVKGISLVVNKAAYFLSSPGAW